MFMVWISNVSMSTARFTSQFGQRNYNRAKQDICSLLGIVTLLGITWGLVFFSFGQLGTAGLYLFCILNSLQGWSALLTLNIWEHEGLCYVTICLCVSCFILIVFSFNPYLSTLALSQLRVCILRSVLRFLTVLR